MLLLEHVIQTLLSFVTIIVHQDVVWEYVRKILHMISRYFLLTVQVKKRHECWGFFKLFENMISNKAISLPYC